MVATRAKKSYTVTGIMLSVDMAVEEAIGVRSVIVNSALTDGSELLTVVEEVEDTSSGDICS